MFGHGHGGGWGGFGGGRRRGRGRGRGRGRNEWMGVLPPIREEDNERGFGYWGSRSPYARGSNGETVSSSQPPDRPNHRRGHQVLFTGFIPPGGGLDSPAPAFEEQDPDSFLPGNPNRNHQRHPNRNSDGDSDSRNNNRGRGNALLDRFRRNNANQRNQQNRPHHHRSPQPPQHVQPAQPAQPLHGRTVVQTQFSVDAEYVNARNARNSQTPPSVGRAATIHDNDDIATPPSTRSNNQAQQPHQSRPSNQSQQSPRVSSTGRIEQIPPDGDYRLPPPNTTCTRTCRTPSSTKDTYIYYTLVYQNASTEHTQLGKTAEQKAHAAMKAKGITTKEQATLEVMKAGQTTKVLRMLTDGPRGKIYLLDKGNEVVLGCVLLMRALRGERWRLLGLGEKGRGSDSRGAYLLLVSKGA